jgi:hypothetical protein
VGSAEATIYLHNLGTLSDLLQARTVLDALLRRLAESATQKESCHATVAGISRPAAACDSRPPWDRFDEAVRVAALEILARLIARMLAAKQPQETSND